MTPSPEAAGAARFRRAAELLERGARERAYGAAVLLAARGEEVALHLSAGDARPSSVFDVASLTKPLVAALFFVLVQEGKISPEGRLADVLPLRSEDPVYGEIAFLHLLSHTSGLPAYRRLYADLREEEKREGRRLSGTAEGHDRIVGAVLATPLVSRPGTACVYSDLGYILLGRAIEAASFTTLDRLLARALCGPLGMIDTGYNPLASMSECEAGRIVPTGFSEWRGREKAGEVDDENAAAMGGIAGHAGVFSTAHDLFLFSREVLRARRGEGRVLTRSSAMRMTTKATAPAGCAWTLGFDSPTKSAEGGSQSGRYFTEGSFGHLGYTGCSLWIDAAREIAVVLLANRVLYGKQNNGLKSLRPLVHDAVLEEMGP